jgi:hypothetical protein
MFFVVRGAPSRATFYLLLAREGAPRTSAKNSFLEIYRKPLTALFAGLQ